MLSHIEKQQFLRSVHLFAETPDGILAQVAPLLEEITCPAETLLIRQGDEGDAMFILVSGRALVHSGGRTLATLGTGSVFGEMAALDPEPRSASITALEPLHLLRLTRESLHQLLRNRSEMSLALIHGLCQTLRARTGVMVEDYAYLQQVALLTTAAAAVESGRYIAESLDSVTTRTDALGQLARVFQRMIREVASREERLQQQVQDLRIEVDKAHQSQQVTQITGTDYFQQLRSRANDLRNQLEGDA